MIDQYLALEENIRARLNTILEVICELNLESFSVPCSCDGYELKVSEYGENYSFELSWIDPYDEVMDSTYELTVPRQLFNSYKKEQITDYFRCVNDDKMKYENVSQLHSLITLVRLNPEFGELFKEDITKVEDICGLYDKLTKKAYDINLHKR